MNNKNTIKNNSYKKPNHTNLFFVVIVAVLVIGISLVGVAYASAQLTLVGGGTPPLIVKGTPAMIGLIDGDSGDMWEIQATNAGQFRIVHSQNSSKLVIEHNGNVGIGTASPNEKLHVNGNIELSGNLTSSGSICIGNC